MTLGDWRDLSIILLAIEAIVIATIYGVVFYYLWKGFRIATTWLRTTGLPQSNLYSRLLRDKTKTYSKKIVRPIVQVETTTSEISNTVRTITDIPKQRTRR